MIPPLQGMTVAHHRVFSLLFIIFYIKRNNLHTISLMFYKSRMFSLNNKKKVSACHLDYCTPTIKKSHLTQFRKKSLVFIYENTHINTQLRAPLKMA